MDAGTDHAIQQQRIINYIQVVSATLLVFDWILVFRDEVKHVWVSRWSFVKVLYLWTRYSPVADTVLGLLSHFAFISSKGCKLNNSANSFFLGIGVYSSELVLIWRTVAIWQDSKWVKYCLGGVWLLMIPVDLYLVSSFISSTVFVPQSFPGQPGCNLVKANSLIAGDFISLAVLEIVIVVLTLIKGVQHMQVAYEHARLMTTLYRDGVLFFVCLAVLSVANVLAPLIGPKSNALLLPTFLRVMHSTLCCRVILHIRSAAAFADMDDTTTIARRTVRNLEFQDFSKSSRSRRQPTRSFLSGAGVEYLEMLTPVGGAFSADVNASSSDGGSAERC